MSFYQSPERYVKDFIERVTQETGLETFFKEEEW